MSVKNAQLMSQLWLTGSSSYQQRISSPSIASTAQQVRELFSGENVAQRNEFIDGLMNRVGLAYVRQHSWRSPLNVFKKRRLEFGDTVLESQARMLVGRTYDDSRETLLKVHRPEVAQAVHKLDYFMQYPYTVNLMELKRAATGETGLNEYVAAIMDAAMTSAEWDQYKSMVNLLGWYASELGMYSVHMDQPADEATSKAFLQKVRELAGLLQFPSGKYMAQTPDVQGAGLTTWADPQDLVLLTTPGIKAAIDVQALAAAFQLPYAEIEQRIVLIDEMPMPDVFAVLTTADFFQVYDQDIENGSFYNPETLNSNYYFTITAVHSVSPFVPVIAFTTGEGTSVDTITQTVETNQVVPEAYVRSTSGNLEPLAAGTTITKDMVDRGVYLFGQLQGALSLGSVSGAQEIDGVFVRPDAYTVEGVSISGTNGGTAPRRNSRTFLDANGRLHVQAAGYRVPGGMTITVELLSAYRNPSGATPEPQTSTYSFYIAGPGAEPGPGPEPTAVYYARLEDAGGSQVTSIDATAGSTAATTVNVLALPAAGFIGLQGGSLADASIATAMIGLQGEMPTALGITSDGSGELSIELSSFSPAEVTVGQTYDLTITINTYTTIVISMVVVAE